MNTQQVQGYVAYFAGKTLAENLYVTGSTRWTDWDSGWKQAKGLVTVE